MAVAAPARHPTRRARPVAPRNPRRVSGPVARPRPVPAPAGRPAAERLRTLPDHRLLNRLLNRLLHGRAWIWVIGIALLGIVAMQVSLLKLNSGISRAVQASKTLESQNSDLEASNARLDSAERIRTAAEGRGMVTPPAGDLHYLRVRPGDDASRAATRITPPSDAARLLMANGGREPGALALAPAAAAPVTAAPAQELVAAPVASAETAAPVQPAAQQAPAAAPAGGAPAPTPTATPVPGTSETAAAPAPAGPQG